MSASERKVLLTGPAGLVGAAVLERLPADRVICLSHRSQVERDGVRVVRGDVTRPLLGLSPDEHAALAREVGVVVHSAAATRFDAPEEETLAVNVGGTRNIVELARAADARLVQVSTAFVSVKTDMGKGWVSAKPYLDSKRAAEEVVTSSGLDYHLVRPSVVIGHSETGHVPAFQGYHFWVRSLLRELLPIVPVEETDRLDFVAQDLVGEVVAEMALAPPPGRESWVTAGEESMLINDWVPAVLEISAELGHELEAPPRLVDPAMVDRLIRPVFFPQLPKRYERRYDQVTAMSHGIVIREPFETSLPELREHYGRPFELRLLETLRASTRYLLGTVNGKVAVE